MRIRLHPTTGQVRLYSRCSKNLVGDLDGGAGGRVRRSITGLPKQASAPLDYYGTIARGVITTQNQGRRA